MRGNERAGLLALRASVSGTITMLKENMAESTNERVRADDTGTEMAQQGQEWLCLELRMAPVRGDHSKAKND